MARIISFGSKDALIYIPSMKKKLMSGEKSQTIRKPRKDPFYSGDKIQIYWKQRAGGGKLFDAMITEILDFRLTYWSGFLPILYANFDFDTDEMAKQDGFIDYKDMVTYLMKGYPNQVDFRIIRWRKI